MLCAKSKLEKETFLFRKESLLLKMENNFIVYCPLDLDFSFYDNNMFTCHRGHRFIIHQGYIYFIGHQSPKIISPMPVRIKYIHDQEELDRNYYNLSPEN